MAFIAVLLVSFGLAGCGLRSSGINGSSEPLGNENLRQVPRWVRAEKLPRRAVPGARLFARAGCLVCHTYLGSGSRELGAPDLTGEGAKQKGIRFQVAHLECPSCLTPDSPMPSYRALGRANLHKLAVFLEASTGPK